jgi:hypothetical protein
VLHDTGGKALAATGVVVEHLAHTSKLRVTAPGHRTTPRFGRDWVLTALPLLVVHRAQSTRVDVAVAAFREAHRTGRIPSSATTLRRSEHLRHLTREAHDVFLATTWAPARPSARLAALGKRLAHGQQLDQALKMIVASGPVVREAGGLGALRSLALALTFAHAPTQFDQSCTPRWPVA